MATHKNYVEGFGRDRNNLIDTKLIPNQNQIFNLFSIKFHSDAEKDGDKGRVRLQAQGEICANACKDIHNILGGDFSSDKELASLINNIVNLDYQSLQDCFVTLKEKYSSNQKIKKHINKICNQLGAMWKISKPHTTIQTQN